MLTVMMAAAVAGLRTYIDARTDVKASFDRAWYAA